MGLWGKKKRSPATHRRCLQVIGSLREELVLEKQTREKEKDALEARIKKLEARLNQDSSNSSRPPSSDFPHRKYPQRTSSGKKRGGQQGHRGHSRHLFSANQVTQVISVKSKPKACRHCASTALLKTRSVLRRQVMDLPDIPLDIKEYRRFLYRCQNCKRQTAGPLPAGIPSGVLGPGLQSVSAFAVGELKLSKRQTTALLTHLFGVTVSAATVVGYEKKTAEALSPAYEEVKARINNEPSAHVDETGWKENNQTAWLWTAKTPNMTVYQIDRHRSRAARNRLLRKFKGVLISDQLSTYADWKVSKWQVCWAHIRRYLKGFEETEGQAAAFGRKGLLMSDAVFHAFHQMKRGELSFSALAPAVAGYREVFHGLLEEGLTCLDKAVANVCVNWLKREDALWTFTRIPDIEPTNNAAERCLRPAVLHRKRSYGTQSEAGSQFLERLLTVIETLKQHHQGVMAFLVKTLEARLVGESAPRLLPNTS